MNWYKIKFSRFGFGHDAGPPPSYRFAWLHVFWGDWDAVALKFEAEIERYKRALQAAREELRK